MPFAMIIGHYRSGAPYWNLMRLPSMGVIEDVVLIDEDLYSKAKEEGQEIMKKRPQRIQHADD